MCIFLFVVKVFSRKFNKGKNTVNITSHISQMKNENDGTFNVYMEHIHENHDLVPV